MPQYLNEYLVRLGFDPDKVGYARFTGMLRDVESQVSNRYWNMAKKVGEFQFATLGAFTAIGAGTLGFMDRVAMADQNYRLFALHMYTSLPVARNLKVALDALGQPLENVMWDPELAARFHQLVEDQRRMTEMLGPDFEKNMLRIRDIRFEFTRFGVEMKYFGMTVVNDLFKALGKGSDDTLANLRHLNEWFQANIPFFSYWVTQHLQPMLADARDVFKTIATEVVGIDWDKVAAGVEKVVHVLAEATKGMTHLVAATVDISEGKYKQALEELAASGAPQAVVKAATPGPGSVARNVIAASNPFLGTYMLGSKAGNAILGEAKKMAQEVSGGTGIPMGVLLKHWAYETGGFTSRLAQLGNLAGIKIPGTDKFASFGDAEAFVKRDIEILRSYIKRYGAVPQTSEGLARMFATAGPGGHPYSDQSAAQYAAGMNHYDIDINVSVAGTNADPREIAVEVQRALEDSLRRPPAGARLQIQRNINEFQTRGWSYGE